MSSNLLVKMFANSLAKDLAKTDGKNPIDAALSNPIVKQLAKGYRKEIVEAVAMGEQQLMQLIEAVELKPGETQIAPFLDIDENAEGVREIRLVIAAFEDTNLTRVISDIPLRQFLTDWFNEKLK